MGKDLRGKELGEGLCQIKDGRYLARYTNRFGKRIVIYAKTLKEVKSKLNKQKYEDQLLQGVVINKQMTLEELANLWLESKEKKVKKTTLSGYTSQVATIVKDLGTYEIYNISVETLSDFFEMLQKRGLSYGTRLNLKHIVSTMFKYAVSHKWILQNPCGAVDIAKTEDEKGKEMLQQERFLTQEQTALFLRFLDDVKHPKTNLYKLLLCTGVRIGEAVALRWSDIDFQKRTISINKTIAQYTLKHKTTKVCNQVPKTSSSVRVLPMNNNAYEILQKQRNDRYTGTEFVFMTNRGTPVTPHNMDTLHKYTLNRFKKYLEKQSEQNSENAVSFPDMTPHYLRHTFATTCFEAKVSPKIIQKYLGHSSIKTTLDIYTHITPKTIAQEMQKLDDFF